MTNPIIKICGLSTDAPIQAARGGGATHLGFIFFAKSPRNITPQLAAKLVKDVQGAELVAVSVNADDEFLDSIVTTMKPTMLQLHGSETPQRVSQLKSKYNLPIIKAVPVRDREDLKKAKSFDGVADILLLDANPPKGADLPGGNGVSFEWSLVENFTSTTPLMLSGGIDLQNVKDAMALIKDDQNSIIGIDLSSGVESTPGVKDISKIKAFMAACRLA